MRDKLDTILDVLAVLVLLLLAVLIGILVGPCRGATPGNPLVEQTSVPPLGD